MIQLLYNQHSGAVVSTAASQQDGVAVILIYVKVNSCLFLCNTLCDTLATCPRAASSSCTMAAGITCSPQTVGYVKEDGWMLYNMKLGLIKKLSWDEQKITTMFK